MALVDHQRMVADRVRVAAYRDALRQHVRPGDVVVDLGTGTGLLAVMAAQAGASTVYGLEWGSVHTVARQVAAANGFAGIIDIRHGDSRQQLLARSADWIVCELMGSFGIEENLIPLLIDARTRWLKPGGGLIPSRLALQLAPVTAPATDALLSFWQDAGLGLDLSPVAAAAKADLQRCDPQDLTLLAPPECWQDVDLRTVTSPHLTGRLTWQVTDLGLCHGFAGWFQAELGPDHRLDNAPQSPGTHWGCAFLPLADALPLTPGDVVHLDLKAIYALGRTYISWQWQWQGADGQTARGQGGSDELWQELAVPPPSPDDAGPVALTPDGETVRTVLALCREGRTAAAMAALLQESPDFADPAVALRTVRRVLKRYGRQSQS